jgi:epoxyqueuosine reductase
MEADAMKEKILDSVRSSLESLGGDAASRWLWGLADMRGLLMESYAAYPSAVSIAFRLNDDVMDGAQHGPTRAYFEHHHEANAMLAEAAERVAAGLESIGVPALALHPSERDAGLDAAARAGLPELQAAVSHKMAATRAGLGWIGKTDLLVTPAHGPRVRLCTVLFSEAVEGGAEITESRCGSCVSCMDACPAKAGTGVPWKAGMPREAIYDAKRCREVCLMLTRGNLGEDASICGICMSACPLGRRAARESEERGTASASEGPRIEEVAPGKGIYECARTIRRSFSTVAAEFGLTIENAPTNPAFLANEAFGAAAARGSVFFGLREGSSLSGCVAIERAKDDQGAFYVERLAVLPARRHRGFGERLMERACAEIAARGGTRALIGIIDENAVLKRWYASMGFAETGKRRFPSLPFTVCFMEKNIERA